MRCLPEYYAEADPTTAILKDPRKLNALQQRVHHAKQKLSLQFLQIKEITEEEFSQRAAAATAAAPFPPPASSAAPPPATDHSRSPRRTLVRHTPFESVKGLLPTLSDAEMHVILALAASRLAPKHVTPQTSLIAAKLELQREVMQRPWREWADVVAPMIALWRADPSFEPLDLNEVTHMTYDRLRNPTEGSFHEAVEFLFNWPPHDGTIGNFKKTRCCELDPPIFSKTWYKSGPLCPVSFVREFARGDGTFRIPHEAHAVFYAEVQFIDCQNELTPMVRIRHKHFLENRGWATALPPPDFKLWASTPSRFEWAGKVVDYGKAAVVVFSANESGDRDVRGLVDRHGHVLADFHAPPPSPGDCDILVWEPELQTAADRLEIMRANVRASGMQVPQVRETSTDEEEGPEEPMESAQELMDRYYAEEPDAS